MDDHCATVKAVGLTCLVLWETTRVSFKRAQDKGASAVQDARHVDPNGAYAALGRDGLSEAPI